MQENFYNLQNARQNAGKQKSAAHIEKYGRWVAALKP